MAGMNTPRIPLSLPSEVPLSVSGTMFTTACST